MPEEKKSLSKQSKKSSAAKKEDSKPAVIKPVLKEEPKTLSKNNLKVGDIVQASVFTGIRGEAKIISTDKNITTVEFEGKSYTTKTKNVRKIKE